VTGFTPISGNAAYAERFAAAVMGTYPTPPMTLVRGQGSHVWDADGREYVDLLAGIATSSLGHAHPAVVDAVTAQVARIAHTSNVYGNEPSVRLAERLLRRAGHDGRVFFCNSGAEANEAALKLSRRTGRTHVVAAQGSFHGRTMGALALTGQPSKQQPFRPLPGEVTFVPYGDERALAAAVTDATAAVVLEPIQGEGGVLPAPAGYLASARRATAEHGALLVLDEVQTGVGRTGTWFAFQRDGVVPDAVTVAKGLGGGLPIGALLAFGEAAQLLRPGDHASTFGGNPVSAAAALAVLDTIEGEGLLQRVARTGDLLRSGIESPGHPLVARVRGVGLLLAIVLTQPRAAEVVAELAASGFLAGVVAPDAVRLAPPLVLPEEDVQAFQAALPAVLDRVLAGLPATTGTEPAAAEREAT
jgi:acetylornithine/N-succinyldiaminopimelate aminotransferase